MIGENHPWNIWQDFTPFCWSPSAWNWPWLLWRTGKKQGGAPDHDELKRWLQQQLDAQAREFAARQSALAEQNHTALRSVSETLQTAVQNMSTTLAQGQDSQQQLWSAVCVRWKHPTSRSWKSCAGAWPRA